MLSSPGNTLYGISRTYEVSITVIQASNDEALVEGLKVNQTLLIPVTSENRKSLPEVVQDENVIVHTVQPGQTLYSISQEYNCTLDDILEANPVVRESGLQANAEIRIPTEKISVESTLVEPAAADSLLGHKVQAERNTIRHNSEVQHGPSCYVHGQPRFNGRLKSRFGAKDSRDER